MAVSIACPQCRSVMRSANPIPAGKKVKCPKCAAVFNAPANGVAAGKPSASGTAGKPGVMPNKPSAAGTARVAPNKPSAAGGAKVALSKPSASGTSARRKGGSKFKRILVLATLLLLVGGGLWVYSQLGGSADNTSESSSQASATQPTKEKAPPPLKVSDDPFFYLPPDSTAIAGIDPNSIMQVPIIKANLAAIMQEPNIAMMQAEMKRLTGYGPEEVERVIFAGTGSLTADKPESVVLVVRTKAPVDAKKLAQLPDVVETKKGSARPYYTLKSSAATLAYELRACCAPTDRLVVVAMGSAKRVEEAMGNPGTMPSLRPELVPILRKGEKYQLWTVVPLDEVMRKNMEPLLAAAPALMPELADPAKALNQALAAGFWVGADAKEVRVSAGVLCPTDAVARDLNGGLGVVWAKNKAPLQEKLQPITKELPGDLRDLIEDVFKTGAVAVDGELVAASIRFNMTPIEGLVKIAKAVGPNTLLASINQAAMKTGPGAVPAGGENEKALLAQVNKTRDEETLPMLKPDAKLFAAALQYAKVAAKDGNFDGIKLEDISESVKGAGYQFQAITANLAIAPAKEKYDAEQTIKNWMGQDVTKANLLNKEYNECGIGMAASGADELFIIFIFTKLLSAESS